MNKIQAALGKIKAHYLIALGLGLYLFAPAVRAVIPPPDGGYPNQNTAEGDLALFSLTTGVSDTAIGSYALYYDTTGSSNTALGSSALLSNVTGFDNTATGTQALVTNTTGSSNTADGQGTLILNMAGNRNTASGWFALSENETGNNNTAFGALALNKNTTGTNNIALGFTAGTNLTTGNNNIDIFDKGVAGEKNTIRLGEQGVQQTTYVAGVSGATVAGGVEVVIDTNGHLGTVTSSARFKDGIKPMAKSSEALLDLQPVTFRYKKDLDPAGIPQFGLVAEQVAKVDPDLVARDAGGKPYTVRYEAVNAMLLNEFLKEHRRVSTLEADVARLESQIKKQASQLQKVSASIRVGAPTVVAYNP